VLPDARQVDEPHIDHLHALVLDHFHYVLRSHRFLPFSQKNAEPPARADPRTHAAIAERWETSGLQDRK